MSDGSQFQVWGATTEDAWRANSEVLRSCDSQQWGIRSDQITDVCWHRGRHCLESDAILCITLCMTGSQWSNLRSGCTSTSRPGPTRQCDLNYAECWLWLRGTPTPRPGPTRQCDLNYAECWLWLRGTPTPRPGPNRQCDLNYAECWLWLLVTPTPRPGPTRQCDLNYAECWLWLRGTPTPRQCDLKYA